MTQLSLFDPPRSREAKQAGMALAAANRDDLLVTARRLAHQHPRAREGITADDVVEQLVRAGYDVHSLGNAAGSLFRESCWHWTGARRRSARIHAHANELKVWRLG